MNKKKILIASDSFKGSATSLAVAAYLKEGILSVTDNVSITTVPIADGGEGTITCFVEAFRGVIKQKEVIGPLGDKITTHYGLLSKDTVVIEVAETSGLPLVPFEKRNPFHTTSYGLGELINQLLNEGIQTFYIGLGGSSTNDMGIGLAQALGFQFLDDNGKEVDYGAAGLMQIKSIQTEQVNAKLYQANLICITDVDNPLCGSNGASYIYGPQKGAKEKDLPILDQAVSNFATLIETHLACSIRNIPGTGAAGGIGAMMVSLLNAQLYCGIDKVIELLDLENQIKNSDLVITGEGKMDQQSLMGKAPYGIAKLAYQYHIPTIAVCGSYDASILQNELFILVLSILNYPMTLEEAMKNTPQLLKNIGKQIGKLLSIA